MRISRCLEMAKKLYDMVMNYQMLHVFAQHHLDKNEASWKIEFGNRRTQEGKIIFWAGVNNENGSWLKGLLIDQNWLCKMYNIGFKK